MFARHLILGTIAGLLVASTALAQGPTTNFARTLGTPPAASAVKT
jgi:hypothetical protein